MRQIKAMCDFFDVDCSPGPGKKVNKDVLIDQPLDFLSAPDKQYTNAYAKKHKKTMSAKQETKKSSSTKKTKSKKAKSSSAEEVEPSESEEEEEEKPKVGNSIV